MHSTAKLRPDHLIALAVALLVAGCDAAPDVAPSAPGGGAGCVAAGFLDATLYGAVEVDIHWRGAALSCEGMPRPGRAGARLRFSGLAAEDHRIAIIIAIPGLVTGGTGDELASNVTLMEEGTGRFYSTTGVDACWTDIDDQSPLPDEDDTYIVSGTLYCISPLGEVNGEASVSIPELRFAGLLDWNAS